MKDIIKEVLDNKRESKRIDFKESFDVSSLGDWCEIIKDIIAIANSGGGHILFGVNNKGQPSDFNVQSILELDPAKIMDKISKYVGDSFSGFEIIEVEKNNKKIAVMSIEPSNNPIVFVNPGTYPIENGRQNSAFSRGAIYFRHGAKSEPATNKDIQDFMNKKLEEHRKSILGNIRKVVKIPTGHEIKVLPKEVIPTNNLSATPIRIVNDPNSPAYHLKDPNKTHIYGLKEVLNALNSKIKYRKIAKHDVYCARKVHKVDTLNPDFFYKPLMGSPQYSASFIEWLLSNFEKNQNFFDEARKKHYELNYGKK